MLVIEELGFFMVESIGKISGSVIFKELEIGNLSEALFDDFNRYQEVKKCWRNENGQWILKDIAFTENWGAAEIQFLVKCLRSTIQTGGTVLGVFDHEKLIGFASLENVLRGSQRQYLQLTSIHISCEYRGYGLGKKLFCRICEKAKDKGAAKLYISAHSSEETQAFYRTMGCVDAEEIQEDIASHEPCDRQLEYKL